MLNSLIKSNKKVQLIYAFNGTGKTRLSREFKNLVTPKNNENEEGLPRNKILYYNAFTEDLFYWDNDLENDTSPILKIQPNSFTDWILVDQGQDQNIISHFHSYSNDKLMPHFNSSSEITFSIRGGNSENSGNIKISKGEENNFIWSVFYTLIEEVFSDLDEFKENSTFKQLEYIFVDDPVSSLDDKHLISLAVELSSLIKKNISKGVEVKFIITTHNPLFYNILFNELDRGDVSYPEYKEKYSACYILELQNDGLYNLKSSNDSPFSYHLYLKLEVEKSIESNNIERYHFNLVRQLLEKLATFLGYKNWKELLPMEYSIHNRMLNLFSHSKHSEFEYSTLTDKDKEDLKVIVGFINKKYCFKRNF